MLFWILWHFVYFIRRSILIVELEKQLQHFSNTQTRGFKALDYRAKSLWYWFFVQTSIWIKFLALEFLSLFLSYIIFVPNDINLFVCTMLCSYCSIFMHDLHHHLMGFESDVTGTPINQTITIQALPFFIDHLLVFLRFLIINSSNLLLFCVIQKKIKNKSMFRN